MLAAFIASLLLTTTTVSAHGFTRGFRVEGSAFDNGPDPGVDTPHGPIRQVTTADPVTDVTSDDIVCGPGASDLGAPRSYPIENGAKMFFTWAGKTKDLPWEHEFGPILTYLASCNGRCNGFDATKAEWYKIDELGQKNGGKSNEWFQADIRRNPEVTVSLPNNIPDGEYLLRHEIIVLNSAGKPGGAQFYPSCTQIKVQGAPTNAGLPPKFRSVSFPGAYKADDAGILVPDVFRPELNYQFPGGPVIEFGGEGVTKTSTSASQTSSVTSLGSSSSVSTSVPAITSSSESSSSSIATRSSTGPSSSSASSLPPSVTSSGVSSTITSSSSSQRTASASQIKTSISATTEFLTSSATSRTDTASTLRTSTSATTDFTTSFSTASPSSTSRTTSSRSSSVGDDGDVDVVTNVEVTTVFEATTIATQPSPSLTTVFFATVIPVDALKDLFGPPASSPTITSSSTATTLKSSSTPASTASAADFHPGRTHRYPSGAFSGGHSGSYKNKRAKNWTNRLEPDVVLFD